MHSTEVVTVKNNLQKIVEEFKKNPVVFPTETVYGLGALVWRPDLIEQVFRIKNRPNDNPLIVHVSSLNMLRECIEGDIPEVYMPIIDTYWPGPLTLLFKRNTRIPDCVTAGCEYVAIRMPNHPDALSIIDALGTPIVGPSANTSTRPSTTCIEHVLHDLNGKVSMIVDGGKCKDGIESTVINGIITPPLYLRPGIISFEQVQRLLPALEKVSGTSESQKKTCPGTRYKHYSPTALVTLLHGNKEEQLQKIRQMISNKEFRTTPTTENNNDSSTYTRIGFMLPSELCKYTVETIKDLWSTPSTLSYTTTETSSGHTCTTINYSSQTNYKIVLYSLGDSLKDIAQNLFDGLRYLDNHTELIYGSEVPNTDGGLAIMDRLTRASTYHY
ncbi:L-threonylcarbamoyladenylate synthase [Nematocida sp. AWRm80]|nr:L-threonylcarbamoyladenylate synthase [Nematocida sp. AWRm80]